MRNTPKRFPKIGEVLYMYSGLRTKQCEKITRRFNLISTQEIRVHFVFVKKNTKSESYYYPRIHIEERELTISERQSFFIRDGFKDEDDFISFWNLNKQNDCEFIGYLIHWTDFKY